MQGMSAITGAITAAIKVRFPNIIETILQKSKQSWVDVRVDDS